MSTILVTGLNGLIGRAVADRLVRDGRSIVGMDQRVSPHEPFPVLTHDLPDPHRWHEVIQRFGITAIIHPGGISGPMLLPDAPARIVDINLTGVAGLLEAARIHRIRRVVCFSSVVAYGDQPDLSPVTERTLLQPTTMYGATKAAGDALINAYHAQFGVDSVSLRVAGCYGPGRVTPCVIRQTLEAGLRGEAARFRSDPRRTRQFVYVDDVVDAVVAALDTPALTQRTYNLGPGVAHSLSEVEAAIRSCLPQARIIDDPNGAMLGSFGLGVLSIEAAQRDLAFSPRMPLDEGVKRTLAWVRQRGVG